MPHSQFGLPVKWIHQRYGYTLSEVRTDGRSFSIQLSRQISLDLISSSSSIRHLDQNQTKSLYQVTSNMDTIYLGYCCSCHSTWYTKPEPRIHGIHFNRLNNFLITSHSIWPVQQSV